MTSSEPTASIWQDDEASFGLAISRVDVLQLVMGKAAKWYCCLPGFGCEGNYIVSSSNSRVE